MIPLHLALISGGMVKPPLRYAILFVQKPRNGDNSYSSDGKKEEELMGVWKVMQQFEPPIRKCSVRCSMEVSKYGHRRARTSLRRERRAEF